MTTTHTLSADPAKSWRQQVGGTRLALLYKHSPYCGMSATARSHLWALAAIHPDLPIWQVDVVGQRDLSRQIAEELGIRHESPQAILLVDGVPVWAASHHGVNRTALLDTVERHGRP